MLTEEQIKNLKKGDKLIAEVQFYSLDRDGDLVCLAALTTSSGDVIETSGFYHPSCLSMKPRRLFPPQPSEPEPTPPKYDPTRLFKKGDIVEPCSVNGRWCFHAWEDRSGIHFEVAKDEDPLTAHMELKDPDRPQSFLVHAAFFKLVTPVEETEPYSIIEQPEGYHCVRIMKGTKIHSSIPFDKEECVCRTLEEAKAAAEEERDRLNAEYRKEQQ